MYKAGDKVIAVETCPPYLTKGKIYTVKRFLQKGEYDEDVLGYWSSDVITVTSDNHREYDFYAYSFSPLKQYSKEDLL